MKIGMRTPSVKRSIKARTTGRIKRSVKSTFNPAYGKKGMGYINNPKKAVYNKVYNKTTISAYDVAKGAFGSSYSTDYGIDSNTSFISKETNKITMPTYVPKYNFQYFKESVSIFSVATVIAWCMSIGFSVYTASKSYLDFGFTHLYLYLLAIGFSTLAVRKISYALTAKKNINQSRNVPLSLSTIIEAPCIIENYLNSAQKFAESMLTANEEQPIKLFFEKAKSALNDAKNYENIFIFYGPSPSKMLEELEQSKTEKLKQLL